MKIIIPGGSGHLGQTLARDFHANGHEVVVLSRHPDQHDAPCRSVFWDGATWGEWAADIDGADAVINLAGRSVNCRYTPANRREILDSRVNSTRVVGEAIARAKRPPRVWLQAATATIYAHRHDAANDEFTGMLSGHEPHAPEAWRFSAEVARAWERALCDAPTPRTRKVAMRTAIVMGNETGGAFDILRGLVRRGLGGRAGDGRQFVSWMHEADFARAVRWLVDHAELSGPVNLCAPNPVPNSEFMRALRRACGPRVGVSASEWMLEFGAWAMGTETELVLKSRRVVPGKLMRSGFVYCYPDWPAAAAELVSRAVMLRARPGENFKSFHLFKR